MAKFEVVGDIERDGKTFTVLKGIRGTVFSDKNAETKFTDLDGEFFHVGTWFGEEYGITRKFLMYDHGKNDLSNELAEYVIPNPVIGAAELVSKDESARWFQIEIDKANSAYPWIMELNNLGVLGVSSRTLEGKGVCMKSADGAINQWPEVELSLTTMPADPRTRFSDEQIVTLKSLADKYLQRIEKQIPQQDAPAKDAHLYLSVDADLNPSNVSDIVEAALDAAEDAPAEEQNLTAMLMDLLETAINPWKARVEALEKSLADLKVADTFEDHAKSIKAISAAVGEVKKRQGESLVTQLRKLPDAAKAIAREALDDAPVVETKQEKQVTTQVRTTARSAFEGGYAPGSGR